MRWGTVAEWAARLGPLKESKGVRDGLGIAAIVALLLLSTSPVPPPPSDDAAGHGAADPGAEDAGTDVGAGRGGAGESHGAPAPSPSAPASGPDLSGPPAPFAPQVPEGREAEAPTVPTAPTPGGTAGGAGTPSGGTAAPGGGGGGGGGGSSTEDLVVLDPEPGSRLEPGLLYVLEVQAPASLVVRAANWTVRLVGAADPAAGGDLEVNESTGRWSATWATPRPVRDASYELRIVADANIGQRTTHAIVTVAAVARPFEFRAPDGNGLVQGFLSLRPTADGRHEAGVILQGVGLVPDAAYVLDVSGPGGAFRVAFDGGPDGSASVAVSIGTGLRGAADATLRVIGPGFEGVADLGPLPP
ncbi:MAG: hypothetical protein ACT4PT_09995 [Methanobacteriota archaeon]